MKGHGNHVQHILVSYSKKNSEFALMLADTLTAVGARY